MFVKQIDINEALRRVIAGQEVKVLVPTEPEKGWESMIPDTLQNMLADVIFFRSDPAIGNFGLEEELTKQLVQMLKEEEHGKTD